MLFPQKFPLLILFLSLGEEQKQRMAWDAAEIVWTLASLNVFLEIFPDISERQHGQVCVGISDHRSGHERS